ncbi:MULTISPECIES: pilus assembly protein TadG-related protein [unclassified Streptomyces]|uniref:pilus assembly protein TadG-related protein n=1 Tax=unclassified Streptomyces TaxID=2593676 RepID=UPI0033B17C3C
MTPRLHGDSGQAAPLYIAAVVGLLFLALMFFAFGQADVRRNETQTAADAAALAAAKDSRDGLDEALRLNILDPVWLGHLIDGTVWNPDAGCSEASRFAAENDARNIGCAPLADGRWGATVKVKSGKPVGKSIVEGTEGKYAEATATAVVETRCSFERNEATEEPPTGGEDEDPEEEEEKPSPGQFFCDGEKWVIDPTRPDLLPDMADLFDVHLAKD